VAVGLRRDAVDLRRRIDARVARMVQDGLVAEVRALVLAGHLGPTSGEMIGVKELVPALEREIGTGVADPAAIDAALAEIRQHTWILSRRQATWWKRFPGVRWLDVSPEETPEVTGWRIVEAFGEPGRG
jgi:tRNA dimethylallyltransferase